MSKYSLYTYCIVRHTSEMIQWDSWIIVFYNFLRMYVNLYFCIKITENLFCTYRREIIKIIINQLLLSQLLPIILNNIDINTGTALLFITFKKYLQFNVKF